MWTFFLGRIWLSIWNWENSQLTDIWEIGVFDNWAPFFYLTDFDYKNKFAKLQRLKNQRAARTEMEAKGEIQKTVASKKNVGHTSKRLPRSESGTSERREAKTKTFSQGMIFDRWILYRGKFVLNICTMSC